MTGAVKLSVRRKWNILLRTAYGAKSRVLHRKRGLTLVTVRNALQCQPILFYVNVRSIGFALHTARRSSTQPHWMLMFGTVRPWRTLEGKSTVGQSPLVRWYGNLMNRTDVPGYSYDVWSRTAQDKRFTDKRKIKILAKSEYEQNPERLHSGEAWLKPGPPTEENVRHGDETAPQIEEAEEERWDIWESQDHNGSHEATEDADPLPTPT